MLEVKEERKLEEDLPTGRIEGLSNEVYHGAKAWSHSKMEYLREFPCKGLEIIEGTFKKEATRPMIIGSAVHCLFLEGEAAFNRDYYSVPEDAPNRNPKPLSEYKRQPSEKAIQNALWWEDFDHKNAGKTELSAKEYQIVLNCKYGIEQNNEAMRLLSAPGKTEVTFRSKLPLFYLQCKADYVSDGIDPLSISKRPYICDIKVVNSLRRKNPEWLDNQDKDNYRFTREWSKLFGDRGYYRQDPLYRDIVLNETNQAYDFYFIAVESQEPYKCAVIQLDDDSVAQGAKENKQVLDMITQCYQTNEWPDINQDEVYKINIPNYQISQNGYN